MNLAAVRIWIFVFFITKWTQLPPGCMILSPTVKYSVEQYQSLLGNINASCGMEEHFEETPN